MLDLLPPPGGQSVDMCLGTGKLLTLTWRMYVSHGCNNKVPQNGWLKTTEL